MIHRVLVAGVACLGVEPTLALEWGVNGHPFTAYPGLSFETQIRSVRDLGAVSYRVNVSDLSHAPGLAKLVPIAKSYDVEILPVITPSMIDLDEDSVEVLYDKAHDLAVSLVTQFKDDIRVWELGNEMENYAIIQPCEIRDDGTQYPCEWGPAGGVGPLEYYGPRWEKVSAVLKGLSDGVHEVDPEIRKAIGTSGWGHVGAFERLRRDGIDWDISVWHMYGQDPEWAFKELVQYGRPIWVTEFNHPGGSSESEQQQAEGLLAAMKRLQSLSDEYDIEAAHIYELFDESYWTDFEAFMGLLRLDRSQDGWGPGGPKPAYAMARAFMRADQPIRDRELAKPAEAGERALGQARYAHCLVLGTEGDAEVLSHWVYSLDAHELAPEEVAAAMFASDEFVGRWTTSDMTDEEFIAFTYRLLLSRDPDKYSSDSYLELIREGSLSRQKFFVGIIRSPEFQDRHHDLFSSP